MFSRGLKKLDANLTLYNGEGQQKIDDMLNNKYITKQEYRCPTENLEHTQTLLFYGPPKIHKIFNYFPPLQPSASNLNSCNGNLSKFFDSFLKPQAQ